jgi:hypothetical protein
MTRTGLRANQALSSARGRSQELGQPQRISSPAPRFVALILGLMASAILILSVQEATSQRAFWLLLFLAFAHGVASVTCAAAWKQVWRGEHHYHVSTPFKSGAVRGEDVCAVVEAPGVFVNVLRIHFRRRTRFGWTISYLPANSALSPTLSLFSERVSRMINPRCGLSQRPERE